MAPGRSAWKSELARVALVAVGYGHSKWTTNGSVVPCGRPFLCATPYLVPLSSLSPSVVELPLGRWFHIRVMYVHVCGLWCARACLCLLLSLCICNVRVQCPGFSTHSLFSLSISIIMGLIIGLICLISYNFILHFLSLLSESSVRSTQLLVASVLFTYNQSNVSSLSGGHASSFFAAPVHFSRTLSNLVHRAARPALPKCPARLSPARLGSARLGSARHGSARHGSAWSSPARPGRYAGTTGHNPKVKLTHVPVGRSRRGLSFDGPRRA